MYATNSVLIPVSDDESDELTRKRPRVRRKRKKPLFHRVKRDLPKRFVRFLVKYWALLIFVPAVVLFCYEAFKLGNDPPTVTGTEVDPELDPIFKKPVKAAHPNLNRMDPSTRMVDGVREPCLKLLPSDELELLDVPSGGGGIESPVKNVIYLSEKDVPDSANATRRSKRIKFNAFTGYPSLEDRDKSFMVKQDAAVHCGFFSENAGFRISEADKSYMDSCKVVVSTCAFGGGDDLYQPIGMSNASAHKVCYVAFWDDITLAAQETAGHTVGKDKFIGKWRIVLVEDLPFVDQRLNGKIPKMLGHRLFRNAKYSIWVDSKSQFRRDPLGVVETLLWRTKSVLAISEHGARSSVYDEAKAVVDKHKARPEEVEVQMTRYKKDGMPEDKRFNGKKALNEASIIVREHTPITNLFMCIWFNEAVRFTSRDQLSFPYVLWRLKALKDINMFPVCTRKDLVNSIGHIRKAKRERVTQTMVMICRIIFCVSALLSILVVFLLAFLSPIPHHSSKPWVALSLYVQQPQVTPSTTQPATAAGGRGGGAFVFHRSLTEGPENTSRVVGKAQGFIIPVETFADSAFNVVYLTFRTPEFSGSLSVQAKNVAAAGERQLAVVGGTGSFAFARGFAVFAQNDQPYGTYQLKLQLRFPNRSQTIFPAG
ncbi:Probable hexosyltransferase MUCI70 [Linum grandiflorum]